MAGEKYVVAAADNPTQVLIRNILNPYGYFFLGNCFDPVSLIRLVRSYNPDFVVIDLSMKSGELKRTLETIDDEMLCACIIIGDRKDLEVTSLLEKSNIILFCGKPLNRDILIQTVDMAILSYRRISELSRKLKEMTDNYETRKTVERAKWILMERDGLSESEAYEKMRKKSMDTRTPMRAIAEAIIFAHEISGKGKGSPTRDV